MDEEWSGALNAKKNETINGSGVYVDVENLQGEAQELMSGLMFNWPETAPPPSRLTLYVRADQTELWYLWAIDQFENVEVVVKGIQHFSRDSSKNSADIAIATNAITDFVRGRISYVVVFSDDSDFISLYSAIRDEVDQTQGPTPFLWVVTDRHKSLSPNVKQFFPKKILHIVSMDANGSGPPSTPPPLQDRPTINPRPIFSPHPSRTSLLLPRDPCSPPHPHPSPPFPGATPGPTWPRPS